MLIVAVELVWLPDSVSIEPKFMLETLKLQLCAQASEGLNATVKRMMMRSIFSSVFSGRLRP
ncbi:hypothetical protein [Mesorhizobium sp. M00.F.Ca.ET.216.01.1.1]|uniref:hypothetical protein n=1 Tax=Mesorhizobium sp. M00.F.Ca.ET.216.01.1.1 TaxID=2500528 RepID=UPI0026B9FE82